MKTYFVTGIAILFLFSTAVLASDESSCVCVKNPEPLSQKLTKELWHDMLRPAATADEEETVDEPIDNQDLLRSIAKARASFLGVRVISALSFLYESGYKQSLRLLGDDAHLDFDNRDDWEEGEDDILYQVDAYMEDLLIKEFLVLGMAIPARDAENIPTWNLSVSAAKLALCGYVTASADLTRREEDGSALDYLPEAHAETDGDACVTLRNVWFPVQVTIAPDEDGELAAQYEIMPYDASTIERDVDVDLNDLEAFGYASGPIIKLLNEPVEELLEDQLITEELLEDVIGEILVF